MYFLQAVSLVECTLIDTLGNRYLDWRQRLSDCIDITPQLLRSVPSFAAPTSRIV